MPGLTGKSGEASQSYSPPSTTPTQQKNSSSPIRPPIEPLSPVLGPKSRATDAASSVAHSGPTKKTFTHTQAPTQYVAQPPPKSISLEENPDAIAIRAAISILQLQKRKAEGDLIALQTLKHRAREDPEGFRDALLTNQIPKKVDGLLNLSKEDLENSDEDDDNDNDDNDDDDENEDEEDTAVTGLTAAEDDQMTDASEVKDTTSAHRERNENSDKDEPMMDFDQPGPSSVTKPSKKVEKWPPLPARQNVVRMPVINWSQYAVVGESLDKLHEDQRKNPMEGAPQQLGPDGRVKFVEGGKQRPATIAAPYDPLKDKIEKKKKR